MIGAGLLITRAVELRSENSDLSATQELVPLVEDEVPGSGAIATSIRVDGSLTETGNIPENQVCSICLDAPKDCFFDPCGHCCTCYSCGVRYFASTFVIPFYLGECMSDFSIIPSFGVL